MPDHKFRRPPPEPIDTPLSVTLRRRRVELGLTLQQIADRMDVSEATVQRWESTVNNLRRLVSNSLQNNV